MIFVFSNPKKIKFKNPYLASVADSPNKNKNNVMKNIWSNKKFLKQNYTYLKNLNKKIIFQLAREYKKNFKLNYSLSFWKIIFILEWDLRILGLKTTKKQKPIFKKL